jgi:hypothetical protein
VHEGAIPADVAGVLVLVHEPCARELLRAQQAVRDGTASPRQRAALAIAQVAMAAAVAREM